MCVCECIGGVHAGELHLCNPDLVEESTLDCGLVTYYYSFGCSSKYWFIKGFSIQALWHVVKYHQVCSSEWKDREVGVRVNSPGEADHQPTHVLSSCVLIYPYNSKTLHFYLFKPLNRSMSSYSFLLTTQCCSSSLAYQTCWSLSSYVL